jgi:3-oxoacyl-[acyl-carrier protein] reductase
MKLNLGKNQYLSKNGLHPKIADFKDTPKTYFEGKGNSLQGKVALITGGYKGIGLAIVKSFLREGAKVIFTGRNIDQMNKVYETLDQNNAAYMEWDVADTENCQSLMNKAFSIFGHIDILVNNAGINRVNGKRQGFQEITSNYLRAICTTNFIGVVTMCENYAACTGKHKGKIINILSIAALKPPCNPDWPYGISKWSLLSYTKALAVKLSDKITVNGIAPGSCKTNMIWQPGQSIIERTPNGRIAVPEEVAELALMLAGKSGDCISGQVFCCGGGNVLR